MYLGFKPLARIPFQTASQAGSGKSAPDLSSNHIPICFPFSPPQASHRGLHFASVVRWESEHALEWRERARSSTVRTFNKLCATVQKTFEFDGNHPRKRAFGCFDWLDLLFHRYYRFCVVRLVISPCSFPFWFRFWFCFAPIPLFCGRRLRSFGAWSCSINELERIAVKHEQRCSFL